MKINIHGDKVRVTSSIKTYIEEKISKLDKYLKSPEEVSATVNIRVKNQDQIIEVTIPTVDFTLRREETNKDLYAAIDLVVDKLERQIRKNKDRLSRKYKNSEHVEFNFNYEDEEVKEENNSKIVKRKNISMKPMDEEEAILQIDLLNHDFFVFKNIDEECVSVLYVRKDGNYGIINMK